MPRAMDSSDSFSYLAAPVFVDDALVDVTISWPDNKEWRLLGRGGAEREYSLLKPLSREGRELPVLLGAGLGFALQRLLDETDGPVAVVDREAPILEATGMKARFADDPRVLWVREPTPDAALKALTLWQMQHGGAPLAPLSNAVYLRLNREYYGALRDSLTASKKFDFWARAKYPRFQSWPPRILLVTSQYFLMGEIVTACERVGAPHYFLNIDDKEIGTVDFVEKLLKAVIEFKPDFVFTINHLGVDREGVLIDLLERLELPLASWFVDNPHLILYLYNKLISPYSAIFTWDADNIASLKAQGFPHVHYLALGTDPQRFAPAKNIPGAHPLKSRVSFVGNSMHYKVGHRLKAAAPSAKLLRAYRSLAHEFGEHSERSVRAFLQKHHPDLTEDFEALDTAERSLAFEALITWEATRQYRKRCLEQVLPYNPLIAGDKGWNITFKNQTGWRWHKEINYYAELPHFYPLCDVNFNCTSKQMKGAVNQRVFDVPATASFVLTDWRVQIENLFDPGVEVICFREPGEIKELMDFYLDNKAARDKVALAARARVLNEHTYEHRLQSLMKTMKEIYG